jgi:hypothetical protein
MVYAVKRIIIEKLVKLDNVCYYYFFKIMSTSIIILNLTICMLNYIANVNNFFYTGPRDRHGSD